MLIQRFKCVRSCRYAEVLLTACPAGLGCLKVEDWLHPLPFTSYLFYIVDLIYSSWKTSRMYICCFSLFFLQFFFNCLLSTLLPLLSCKLNRRFFEKKKSYYLSHWLPEIISFYKVIPNSHKGIFKLRSIMLAFV